MNQYFRNFLTLLKIGESAGKPRWNGAEWPASGVEAQTWTGSTPPVDTVTYRYWRDTSATLLAAPTGHSISPGDTTVTLHPGTSPNALSYSVIYTTDGSDPSKSNGTRLDEIVDGQVLTDFVNGVLVKAVYVAVNEDGDSPESSVVSCTPAAPVTLTDDFERADGGLGADWTTVPGQQDPQIVGGMLTAASADYAYATHNTDLNGNDHVVMLEDIIPFTTAPTILYLGSRTSLTQLHGYYAYLIFDGSKLWLGLEKYVNGVWGGMLGADVEVTNNITKLRLNISGSSISVDVYNGVDWTLDVKTATDESIPTGTKVTVGAYGTTEKAGSFWAQG